MMKCKRALSLTLSAALMVGMAAAGSAADYKDVTAAHDREALGVMELLDVMVGDGEGFGPDRPISRNEMAAVTSKLLGLPRGAETDGLPFTDFGSAEQWARPYVAAVYTHGITAGTGEDTFGGRETLTTAQSAMWLLKALGYFRSAEDIPAGSSWDREAMALAEQLGLLEGVKAASGEVLTREGVARMTVNALKAPAVERIGGEYRTLPDSEETRASGFGPGLQLAEKLYGGRLQLAHGAVDRYGRTADRWIRHYSDRAPRSFVMGSGPVAPEKLAYVDSVTARQDGTWGVTLILPNGREISGAAAMNYGADDPATPANESLLHTVAAFYTENGRYYLEQVGETAQGAVTRWDSGSSRLLAADGSLLCTVDEETRFVYLLTRNGKADGMLRFVGSGSAIGFGPAAQARAAAVTQSGSAAQVVYVTLEREGLDFDAVAKDEIFVAFDPEAGSVSALVGDQVETYYEYQAVLDGGVRTLKFAESARPTADRGSAFLISSRVSGSGIITEAVWKEADSVTQLGAGDETVTVTLESGLITLEEADRQYFGASGDTAVYLVDREHQITVRTGEACPSGTYGEVWYFTGEDGGLDTLVLLEQ